MGVAGHSVLKLIRTGCNMQCCLIGLQLQGVALPAATTARL